jgi:hypothetical protein
MWLVSTQMKLLSISSSIFSLVGKDITDQNTEYHLIKISIILKNKINEVSNVCHNVKSLI